MTCCMCSGAEGRVHGIPRDNIDAMAIDSLTQFTTTDTTETELLPSHARLLKGSKFLLFLPPQLSTPMRRIITAWYCTVTC